MNILHLSSYDFGGAANSAIRLHEGLMAEGVDSRLACKTISRARDGVFAVLADKGDWLAKNSTRIDYHLARLLHPRVRPVLPIPTVAGGGMRALDQTDPDLINLHWVDHNFIIPADLAKLVKLGIPLVWTLHDMGPLTGGFSYREAAGLPPDPFGSLTCLDSRARQSAKILAEKTAVLSAANLTLVSPSQWLAREAALSPVFKRFPIEVIPYGIDTGVFHPVDPAEGRRHWGIPDAAKVILFGADTFDDPRKGIGHLKDALRSLTYHNSPVIILGFGNKTPISHEFPNHETRSAGRIMDPADLASLYSTADVFVCPSREDNLPNMVIESLSCGTPVVGFEVGGLPDLVKDGETGYLAPRYDAAALGAAIEKIISLTSEDAAALRMRCRDFAVRTLGLSRQSAAYRELYTRILSR